MSRVGILGGTFDPPHVAHAAMAASARARLGLSTVLLMPALAPPHKPSGGAVEGPSPYAQRLAMTEIAAATVGGVEVSRFEERRSGPSFTVDLVGDYGRETGDELFFVMGSDSLSELGAWHEPQRLLELCTLVVFPRPGAPIRLDVAGSASIVVIEDPVLDVSSSEIRRRVRAGEPVESLVAPGVLAYIRRHGLYTNR